jgi:hypothetical protein
VSYHAGSIRAYFRGGPPTDCCRVLVRCIMRCDHGLENIRLTRLGEGEPSPLFRISAVKKGGSKAIARVRARAICSVDAF